jgi:hypothetical protein
MLLGQKAGASVTDHGGNIFNVDPLLNTSGLQFNGGPTQTVSLLSGSPAIGVVPAADCTDVVTPPHPLSIDQRGYPRPGIGETACDMGAYEFQHPIAFSHFTGNVVIDADAGVFDLSGGFTIGTGATFDPTTHEVIFSVGSYSVKVPAGGFTKNTTGYVFKGTLDGISVQLFFNFTTTPGKYVLSASGQGVIPATTSPVPVLLFSPDSNGKAQMTATFD